MTRRGSRDHGRDVTTDRPAADYTTRTYDTSGPMRTCGLCGCQYRDTTSSRRAHQTVFGHQPATPEDRTATAESAPEPTDEDN